MSGLEMIALPLTYGVRGTLRAGIRLRVCCDFLLLSHCEGMFPGNHSSYLQALTGDRQDSRKYQL